MDIRVVVINGNLSVAPAGYAAMTPSRWIESSEYAKQLENDGEDVHWAQDAPEWMIPRSPLLAAKDRQSLAESILYHAPGNGGKKEESPLFEFAAAAFESALALYNAKKWQKVAGALAVVLPDVLGEEYILRGGYVSASGPYDRSVSNGPVVKIGSLHGEDLVKEMTWPKPQAHLPEYLRDLERWLIRHC